jgi:hypothetical protein
MKFTPEMFRSHQCPALGDDPNTYKRLAEFVQLRFDEWLKERPTVFLGVAFPEDSISASRIQKSTHKAKLVDIEKL